MIAVAVLRDEAAFAALRPEWRALWRRAPTGTPFQSPEWLYPWWRSFGTGEPAVLVARDGGDLVGLLPLYLLDNGDRRKLLPIGVGLSDHLEALVDPIACGCADRLLAAIETIPGWDECWLPDLDPQGPLAGAKPPGGLAECRLAAEPCPVLALPGGSDRLAEIVPRKTLRDLRQARARAAAAGDAAIETVVWDSIGGAMDDLFRLHEKRWRERGETGVCDDPAVRAFHRAAAGALAEAGLLRLCRLRVGGRVLAVYYGFAANGAEYAYLAGFDPEKPRLSPGMQIIGHAIERAVAEGVRQFDFLRGREPYKYGWGAADRAKICRRLTRQ